MRSAEHRQTPQPRDYNIGIIDTICIIDCLPFRPTQSNTTQFTISHLFLESNSQLWAAGALILVRMSLKPQGPKSRETCLDCSRISFLPPSVHRFMWSFRLNYITLGCHPELAPNSHSGTQVTRSAKTKSQRYLNLSTNFR